MATIPAGYSPLWDADGVWLTDENGDPLYVPDTGPAVRVGMGPLPTRVDPGTPITVRAHVSDSVGEPAAGQSVALSVAGVTIITPAARLTDSLGFATFTVTPQDSGTLAIYASLGAIDSAAWLMQVNVDPMLGVIARARAKSRAAAAAESRSALEHRPSYLDVGPTAPKSAPAPAGSMPVQAEQRGAPPGMQLLAQHLAQAVQEQEQKLQAEVEGFRKFLPS